MNILDRLSLHGQKTSTIEYCKCVDNMLQHTFEFSEMSIFKCSDCLKVITKTSITKILV